jgi:hypothetical protein
MVKERLTGAVTAVDGTSRAVRALFSFTLQRFAP